MNYISIWINKPEMPVNTNEMASLLVSVILARLFLAYPNLTPLQNEVALFDSMESYRTVLVVYVLMLIHLVVCLKGCSQTGNEFRNNMFNHVRLSFFWSKAIKECSLQLRFWCFFTILKSLEFVFYSDTFYRLRWRYRL